MATYTENYELPIIEGTDVISRVPHNEGMTKIDTTLKKVADDTSTAVADVNQVKVNMEQEMSDFSQEMHSTLDKTVTQINTTVDNKLANVSEYLLAGQLNTGSMYQICGQTGHNKFPLSQSEFMNYDTRKIALYNDNFQNKYTSSATRYVKVTVDMVVGSDGANAMDVFLIQHNYIAGDTTIKSSGYQLTNGLNHIQFTAIFDMRNVDGTDDFYKYIGFDCVNALTLENRANITIEYLGIDHSNN